MVLLQKIVESAIVENLKKRFMDDCIYVCHLIMILKFSIFFIYFNFLELIVAYKSKWMRSRRQSKAKFI